MTALTTRRKVLGSMLAASASTVARAAPPAKPLGKKTHTRDPKPATPPLYSPAVSYGNLVFLSGRSSNGAPPGDFQSDVKYAFDELEKDLINAGSSMLKVLKVSVFLNEIKDYAAMNEIFLGRFGSEPPARTTVAALVPRGKSIEIDIIAYI